MLPSLIEQVTAATGARIDPMQKYNIKRGSQTDVLHQLLDETGFGWTRGELQHKLGWTENGLGTALHRLKLMGLIERDGVVEVDGRLHCRWKIRRDEE